uniref:Uncharacterized protein n=1 Tax=Laticauda laticaudata TaxID=8630 RepID=A0A8C5SKC7_LATLA
MCLLCLHLFIFILLTSLEKRVRDIIHKAFWDCLETQLKESPPSYDHAIKLVGEIKEALLSFLLPGHTRLRNQITEALDLELIKQEAENDAAIVIGIYDGHSVLMSCDPPFATF